MKSNNQRLAISVYASSNAALNHMTAKLIHDYSPEGRVNGGGVQTLD
ncbi:MAG: hypothetical protein L0J54_09385 [Halomonas sp.]|nr:hypothetical protein [Halomonas sp.]MDN6298217.1 hypothetical protein [Halomonas sp.]MDN6315563.1 hypothetical protein [Halomonas sp.]MDN6336713.1 hypothetical protein [Halomonas sp.]